MWGSLIVCLQATALSGHPCPPISGLSATYWQACTAQNLSNSDLKEQIALHSHSSPIHLPYITACLWTKSSHSVSLGTNCTMKKHCLPQDAYHFHESYASCSHNDNKLNQTKKNLQCHLRNVPNLDQWKYWRPVNWSLSGHQGLAADRAIRAP